MVIEENTIIFILFSRIDPRVANKMNITMAREIFQSQSLEIELCMVVVLYNDRTGDTIFLIDFECNLES